MIHAQVKTKEGTEEVTAYKYNEGLLYQSFNFIKVKQGKKEITYADTYACFDSETSHKGEDKGWIYQWAFKMQSMYFYGRKPSEFINLLIRLREKYTLDADKRLIIYIHNASYDIQYLKHYLKEYDKNIRVFATDSHSVLIVDVIGFRFLCSYKLSNMSLDLFSKTYAEHYLKASGAIDYRVVRYQDTALSLNDWFYMLSDVASQYDAIYHYLKVNGYENAASAPFTSTGFVRADSRRASEKEEGYRKKFEKMQLGLDQYHLLNNAFQGGLTIASSRYAGQTVTEQDRPIKHKDFNSSYPARQMMCYFPTGKPAWYGDIESKEELETLLSNFCCCFILTLEGVHIRTGVTAPCLPASKCIHVAGELKLNGKIIFAESLTIAVTEIDFKWIRKQYTADNMTVSNMLIMKRGKMPDWLRDRIMYYYKNKCTLKKSDPRLYQCSKGLLNGIYGMSATRICRDSYHANKDMIIKKTEEAEEKQLSKFYSSYNSFMPYQFGVWTTAHARDALLTMIEAVGYENFLYCDTDSVFYISTEENEKRLADMNEQIRATALKAGAYYENNVLGIATDEPDIHSFRALHAKCYAMEEYNADGTFDLKVTIAGIPKATTQYINGEPVRITNAEELGCIDNLKEGFVFRHNGGTRSIYIEDEPHLDCIDGHVIECASACIISDIEKEIKDTMWTHSGDYNLMHIVQTDLYNVTIE